MKLFIWDLHGTLEQGNERAAIDMSNQILERFGYRERFSDEDVFKLYGLKWFQYFEYLLPHEPRPTATLSSRRPVSRSRTARPAPTLWRAI